MSRRIPHWARDARVPSPETPKILITGASGFLGQALLLALRQKYPDSHITAASLPGPPGAVCRPPVPVGQGSAKEGLRKSEGNGHLNGSANGGANGSANGHANGNGTANGTAHTHSNGSTSTSTTPTPPLAPVDEQPLDVTNPAQVTSLISRSDPDLVFHLAAVVASEGLLFDPTPAEQAAIYRVNVGGTEKVVRALQELQARRREGGGKEEGRRKCALVFASSVVAVLLNPGRDYVLIDEQHPCEGSTHYGISKVRALSIPPSPPCPALPYIAVHRTAHPLRPFPSASPPRAPALTKPLSPPPQQAQAEALVLAANDPSALLTTALRISAIIGPGDTLTVPSFHDMIAQGLSVFQMGDGRNTWNFTAVQDVVDGMLLGAESLLAEIEDPAAFAAVPSMKTSAHLSTSSRTDSGVGDFEPVEPVLSEDLEKEARPSHRSPAPPRPRLSAAGQAFFLNDPDPVPWRDLNLYIWHLSGHQPPFTIVLPAFLLWFFGLVTEIMLWLGLTTNRIVSRKSAPECTRTRDSTPARAMRVLGWYPRVGTVESIRQDVAAYLKALEQRKQSGPGLGSYS